MTLVIQTRRKPNCYNVQYTDLGTSQNPFDQGTRRLRRDVAVGRHRAGHCHTHAEFERALFVVAFFIGHGDRAVVDAHVIAVEVGRTKTRH